MKQYPLTFIGVVFIIVTVIIIKIFHFIKKVNRKKLVHFFVFPETNIMVSSSKESADAKRLQNTLSAAVVVLSVVAVAIYVLF